MDRYFAFIVFRTLFAVLATAAIVYQLGSLLGNPGFHPLNFFSYFTIQSNAIGAAMLLIGAARRDIHSPTFDVIRGASVVYLVTTGVVFSVLLSGTDVDTAIPWVNSVLHEVMPMVIIIDWLLDPPTQRLGLRHVAYWLAYPLLWVTYTLVRGPLADWYPYPFLDPAREGYTSVLAYCVAISLVVTIIGGAIAWIGNAARREPTESPAAAV
jgi:hypothetical protein